MKDVPVELPETLHLPVIMEREDPRDGFISNHYPELGALPAGARLGSSSLRRQLQIRERYPHLSIETLRGNVNTRLRKLDERQYDAIVLAVAGLKRLSFSTRITAILEPEISLPAIGQGALGIECRRNDEAVHELIVPLNHPESELRVRAERALNARLHGGCQVPIAGYAEIRDGVLTLRGLVGHPDGSRVVRASVSGPAADAQVLGSALGERLLQEGADAILRSVVW
jgi:hydroxymethylbilane synthase